MSKVRSASLRHQVFVQRYANGLARDVIRILNITDRELMNRIRIRLENTDSSGRQALPRLEALLSEVRGLNAQAYRAAERELTGKLKAFAEYEVEFQSGMVSKYLPVGANFTSPPVALVAAAVENDPLRGKMLREWVSDLSEARYGRVRDTLRVGIVEGRPTEDIVRQIAGTRAGRYQDGLIEIDRQHAVSLVRTATNAVANEARQAVFEENDDIVEEVQWLSTLDDRACPLCAALDGQTFPLDSGPRPPRHINCRCTLVPVLKAEFDLLSGTGETRASRGSDGPEQVPATQTYQTWLSQQSAEFQDEALGSSRGALFRRGGLSVDKFVNRAGDELTLAELRLKEPEAFRRANLKVAA